MPTKKPTARRQIPTPTRHAASPPDVNPPQSFVELTREIGTLQSEMAGKGWVGGHEWSILDFTGGWEEAKARQDTEPILQDLQKELGVSSDAIWPVLIAYLPHFRRSEFERVEDKFKKMKAVLWGEFRKRQSVKDIAWKIQYPPYPDDLRARIAAEYEVILPVLRHATTIAQIIKSLGREFRQHSNPSAKKAEAELVKIIIEADPEHNHTTACEWAHKILSTWASKKAPASAEAIRQRTLELTRHKKKRRSHRIHSAS